MQHCELIDRNDVLNYKHISNKLIEAEMLTSTKISFSIKFSTRSKDAKLTIFDGNKKMDLNSAGIHFKTGENVKRDNKSK